MQNCSPESRDAAQYASGRCKKNGISRVLDAELAGLLAARLLGATSETLLAGELAQHPGKGPLVGSLFESLVALSVRVYAQAAEARVGHLRTFRGEREIDLIVERADGKILAIEVKLGGSINDADVKHLLWLKRELHDDVLDAVVVSTGPQAFRRPDGVAVVPLALLGP